MCWMTKLGQCPKCFATNIPTQKVVDIIPNGIISHRAFDDVVVVMLSGTTIGDEVQPFITIRNCTDLSYSAYGLYDICHFLCAVQSAVGVASAQSQEQDVLAEVFIGTKEIVVLPRKMV